MAGADDWGGVPVQQQAQPDDWGGVPVQQQAQPSQQQQVPQLPNMQPVIDMVQNNLSGQEQKNNQTDAQRTDAGLGVPVKQLLKPDAAMPDSMIPHVTDAFKNGTATTNSDYLQTAIPTAAVIANPESAGNWFNQKILGLQQGFSQAVGSVINSIPSVAGMAGRYIGFTPPDIGISKLVGAIQEVNKTDFPELPQTTGNEVAKSIGGFLPAVLAPEAAVPYFATQGIGQADLENKDVNASQGMKDINTLAKGAANAFQAFIPGFKEIPEGARNGVLGYAIRTLKSAGTGAALFPAIGAVNDAIDKYTIDPNKVIGLGAAHQGEVGLLVGALTHGLVTEPMIAAGHEIIKPQIAEMNGKTPENTTTQDITGTIDKSHKNEPTSQDFKTTAAVMGVDEGLLHQIRSETGVRPDQVFADSKVSPTIAEDIRNGRVPLDYQQLREQTPSEEGFEKENPINNEENEKSNVNNTQEVPSITSKGYAEGLYNRLHQKLGEDTATDIQSMKKELATKDAIGKDLDEKFYLKKEDSNVKLSDEEQKLYDDKIKPLAEKERALYERASFLGAKEAVPKTEDYVHRIVKGKGHYLDKYDTEFGSDDDLGFGNQPGISETTSSLKEAQFYALQDKDGNRQLKTGEIPNGYKAGDAYKDEDGKEWTIKRAKTQEIENNTDLRYYKSAVGNTEDNIRRLEKTIRNIEFLNSLKYDMQRTGLGVAPESSYHPPDYRQVHIPQLRGWSFNSRIAEVLNDVYDRGGDSMLGTINNILIKGMYLNPVPHIENVAYDYISSRGWRNVRGIKGVNYLSQAVKDVAEFTPEYLDVLKNGGALRFPSAWKADFFNKMESQFIKEMQQSKDGLDLAKSWGFDSVPSMANSVFNTSQKALWGSSDVFLMAKIRELKDQGMSTVDAIKEAQKHIVDYRIPPRVGEQILGPQLSRMLSKSLQNNAIVVFTRYHYGLFKALGNSVKDLGVGVKNLDPSLISKASGQLFATYFLLTVVNPAISNLWSSVMGEKEKMRNPGSTGLMGAILDAVSGEKSLGNALGTQFIVSPGIKVGSDFLTDKIVDPDKGHEGIQLMDYLMKQPTMSIPSIPYNIREGKATVGQEALDQVGVKPDKPYKKRKPSAASKRRLEDEERGLLGED